MHDEFEYLYNSTERASIDRSNTELLPREVATGWRAGVGVAVMTATALAVRDVLEPKQETPVVEEIDLNGPDHDAPVAYFHVPGLPRESRAIVRPWFFRR